MALKLGSMYVALTAQTTGYSKSMAGAMKLAERFARETKRMSAEVAQVSGVLAAIGGAAVKMAAGVDGPTKKAMEGLERSTQLLAVQVADMLLPAVREMTGMFRSAAGAVAGLDPEVKKGISNFAILAVQLAAGAKVLSLFSGVAANVFGILRAGFAMVASIGVGPLLSIVAVVGLVIAGVLLLHRAWRKNWGGIQEATQQVLDWLKDGFSQFAAFMGKMWDFLVDGASHFVSGLLDVAAKIEMITGKDLGVAGMREGFGGLWADLKSGTFFSEAFTFGKAIGEQLVDGVKEEWAAIKKELNFDGPNQGKTIGLGRGMGPKKDISGHEFAADESMRAASLLAAGALRDLTAEAANFKKGLSDLDAAQEVKRWLKELEGVIGDGFKQVFDDAGREIGKLATLSLSNNEVTRGRFGGAPMTAGQKGAKSTADTKAGAMQAEVQRAADAAGAAMNDAVSAADWGSATKALDAGLKRAATTGESLELWARRMAPLLGAAGQQILGAVGDLVNSVVQGAQAGGVWGAIIAGFMEIVKKAASALEFLGIAMVFVEKLAAMVEPLVKPIFDALTGLLGGIIEMIGPLFIALQPLFDAIAALLVNLGPILSAIGDLIQALAPIIEVIGKIVGVIVEALKPVFDLIAGVIKVIATVILGIIIFLNEIAAAFGDQAAKEESAKLRGIIDRMWAPGSAEADAADRAAAAANLRAEADEKAAAAAQKVAESLSNVPAGFNIANARYQADMGITSANAFSAGSNSSSSAGSTIIVEGDIVTDADTAESLAEEVRETARERTRERGQRTGNPRGGRDD
ncbi:MAG: hypothetical protein Q8K32_31335 [Archangium sp.]|nr:hypothetical protein [Archangium sp.]